MAGNELRIAVGVAIAVYGFFMALFPRQYSIPFMNLVYRPALPPSANQGLGLILIIVGAYLFIRRPLRKV